MIIGKLEKDYYDGKKNIHFDLINNSDNNPNIKQIVDGFSMTVIFIYSIKIISIYSNNM